MKLPGTIQRRRTSMSWTATEAFNMRARLAQGALVIAFIVFNATAALAASHPIITFGTPAPSVPSTTAAGTRLATVSVVMSNGNVYTGRLTFNSPYGNGSPTSDVCAITGSHPTFNLNLGKTLAAGTYYCTVKAVQNGQTASSNITITVTDPVPTVVMNPATITIPSTTTLPHLLSTPGVTMSDGSAFTGTLAFGLPSLNGGGACALGGGAGNTIPPNSSILDSLNNTWTVRLVGANNEVFENGVQNSGGGSVTLLLYLNNLIYVEYLQSGANNWYVWNYATSNYSLISGDPRTPTVVNLGTTLSPATYLCSISATQAGHTGTGGLTVIVTGSTPSPIINFGSPSPSIFDDTAVSTPISIILMTMSDGSTFTGTLGFGAPYSNDGGICAISVRNLTLGKALSPGPSTQQCTVSATQGTQTVAADITITVIGPTLTISFGTPNPSVAAGTPSGTPLTSVAVTASDGSAFIGALSLTGTYGDGGGRCALQSGQVGGASIPPQSSITDSFGNNWTVVGGQVNENGVQNSGGGTTTLMLLYNGAIYVEYLSDADGLNYWYVWSYSMSSYNQIQGDPRPNGAAGVVAGLAALTTGTYNCTVTATQ